MTIKVSDKNLGAFLNSDIRASMQQKADAAHEVISARSGAGNDFMGWIDLPENYDKEEFARVKKAAKKIRSDSQVLVVIGIGGSYLGALSAIELLRGKFYNLEKDELQIFFAGNNISSTYLNKILEMCEGKEISVNVISKSGTTTEPAIAFRVFKKYMEKRYGKDAAGRIYVTTDKTRGTLKNLADSEGYEAFVVPDDIGGRYSVLTSVGLLPIAAAGCDIDKIMAGAQRARTELTVKGLDENPAYHYAALRNAFYNMGKTTEILVSYEPDLQSFSEWFKQLYGESEGKDGKGIFPASVSFSADLHSMGQYIQQGLRNIFNTVFFVKTPKKEFAIPADEMNIDGLSFLDNVPVSYVNERAFQSALLAHTDGGVPNIVLEVERLDEDTYGYMVYFFEMACAASGYMLGVNPFNQPGVEDYKVNMFALLGKPGYEQDRDALEARLK